MGEWFASCIFCKQLYPPPLVQREFGWFDLTNQKWICLQRNKILAGNLEAGMETSRKTFDLKLSLRICRSPR